MYPRFIERQVQTALRDTRAVLIGGSDFSGLRKLKEACGKRFVLGLVLYDHDVVLPVGERLLAAPISTLWK